MQITKTILGAAFIAGLTASGALAQAFEKYGEVEGWKIFIDNDKQSCLIEKIDDVSNVVQMGLTTAKDAAYVGVFTKAETEIMAGDEEAVAILLDENLYAGPATGMRGNITEGYSGGYILAKNEQFIDDVARKYTMTVFPEKSYAFVVDLTGTFEAIKLARQCQSER